MTGRRFHKSVIECVVLVFGLCHFGAPAFAQVAKPQISAEISRVADTAHLEFKGLRNWRYEVQRTGDQTIVLNVPPLDDASLAKLQSFTDPLIDTIEVNKSGPDGTYQVTFHLTQKDVESFDYLTDEPSRLILDFYKRSEPAKPTVKSPEPTPTPTVDAKAKTKVAQAKPKGKKPSTRKPAGSEVLAVETPETPGDIKFGIFDAADENYDRFRIKDYEIREEAILQAKQNIYLPFPMLKMPVSRLSELLERRPEFVIHPKDSRENKEARLLLTLFERKRYGVFLKTFDYFMNKYPESEYGEIIKNLAANVYLQRWLSDRNAKDFENARAYYNELVQKYPDSPLREYNYMILGYALMELGDAIATLQTFEGFLKSYPQSAEIPQIRKGIAEAYLILRKYDEATAQYQQIMKDYPKSIHALEARYRLGDVQFAKGDFSRAIIAYEAAIKDLPAEEKIYPNANFNMAEARFWQQDHKKALNDYVQFVNLFPTHEHGGYALTRIGEVLGKLGADQRRSMGAYLESYFRFPKHPGAKVARVRMLSQQMRSMKPKELKKALDEIRTIGTESPLAGMNEFTTLMVSEGLTGRGDYKDSIANLKTYYQENPLSVNREIFKSRILRNIASEMKSDVEAGKFMDALAFHSKYANTWLKGSDRIDVPFYLAAAYERAGAYPEANRIYQQTLDHRQRIANTSAEREKKAQEFLPSLNSVRLRMAATEVQERKFIEAFQNLRAIGKGEGLTPVETVERVRLSAEIAEQRNDHDRARQALEELAKQWQGDPALVAPVHLKLAQTYLKLNQPQIAESHAQNVLKAEGGETKIDDRVIAEAMVAKAEALMAQKKPLAAVETYQRLLERFEAQMPLASTRYKVGQILFDRGDLKGAADVWGKLQGTPNEFLWKVGQEKLADTQWQDDYTKYVNRIPAMVTSKKKESAQ